MSGGTGGGFVLLHDGGLLFQRGISAWNLPEDHRNDGLSTGELCHNTFAICRS